jgi:hypothetical protein
MLSEPEAEQYARFLSNEEEVLAYLIPQLAELDAQREALESKRRIVADHIARVKESTAYYRAALAARNGNGAAAPIRVPHDAFKGLNLLEAIKKYLRIAGTFQTTREIAKAVKEGGYESTSKNFTNTVRTSLDRAREKGEIISEDKKWGLLGWIQQDLMPSELTSSQAVM